ncbi:hypothetical protein L486_02356 [Kwoniella mangroviensis CBS 10435]|uniref:Uncharacterized protein n=1 Tax=Kwoniella mangroviensis CBS 10435 TaxID=1331196 RepID=A0A1B9IW87_9TREE|nr:hypothetical protein L486_02356 [Kwoniella mangroviensis CBS 10435]
MTLSDLGPSLQSRYEAYRASRENQTEEITADELYEQICGRGRKELIQSHRLSLTREQNYWRLIEGAADQEISRHIRDQSVVLEGDPNEKRLSEVEATEKLFQYFSTFPDAS